MNIEPCYYRITSQQQLLSVKMEYVLDVTTTLAFCRLLEQNINSNQQEWAMIADLRHWRLGSAEACEIFLQHHQFCIQQGLRYQALILPCGALKRWQIRAFTSDNLLLNTLLADDEAHALSWMAFKGFILK